MTSVIVMAVLRGIKIYLFENLVSCIQMIVQVGTVKNVADGG